VSRTQNFDITNIRQFGQDQVSIGKIIMSDGSEAICVSGTPQAYINQKKFKSGQKQPTHKEQESFSNTLEKNKFLVKTKSRELAEN